MAFLPGLTNAVGLGDISTQDVGLAAVAPWTIGGQAAAGGAENLANAVGLGGLPNLGVTPESIAAGAAPIQQQISGTISDLKGQQAQSQQAALQPLQQYLGGREAPTATASQINQRGLQNVRASQVMAPQLGQAPTASAAQANAQPLLAQLQGLQPYAQAGAGGLQAAQQARQQYANLLANPQAVLNDPTVQAQIRAGQQAVETSAAGRGTQLSGATLAALQQKGQEIGGQAINAALQRQAGLAGLGMAEAGMGLQAAGQAAGLGIGSQQAVTLANLQAAQQAAMLNPQLQQTRELQGAQMGLQAQIQNQAAQLQAQGMNQQQALQVATQNAQMQQQTALANLGAQGQWQGQQLQGLQGLAGLGMQGAGAQQQLGLAGLGLSTDLAQAVLQGQIALQTGQQAAAAGQQGQLLGLLGTLGSAALLA